MSDIKVSTTWPSVSYCVTSGNIQVASNRDQWVPGCGGSEVPFLHNGVRWLYVWNQATRKHGYLNLDTDIVEEYYRTGGQS